MPRAQALATISAYYDAFNAGDTTGMEALISPDFEHHVNEGEIRRGPEAFRAFNAHMTRCYKEHLADIVIMANDQGTRAAAEFVVHGVYLETDGDLPVARGQKYVLLVGSFFDLEAGRITRVTTYYNLADWVRQVS